MTDVTHDAPLPPPLRGADTDSFTHHTIVERWPRIVQRVIDENDVPAPVHRALRDLRDDLPNGTVRPIEDPGAPDLDLWREYVAPHEEKSWLEAPWLFGEFYFYRRILEATGYFQRSGCWHVDPFRYQKREGFRQAADRIRAVGARRTEAVDDTGSSRDELARLMRGALWGNQADRSMWGVDEDAPDHHGTEREHDRLLVNQTEAALDHLDRLDRPARLDVWADNAGFELVSDLALIDGLLAMETIETVVVHLKVHPTFVSDATIDDVHWTLDALNDVSPHLSRRLRRAIGQGRVRLCDAWVWSSGTRARELPTPIVAELARSDLLISKGDANYRRLLGDRHWDPVTAFDRAAAPLPVPVLALRTLKSEVVAGLSPDQVRRLNEMDPDWRVNGEWGLIQYASAS